MSVRNGYPAGGTQRLRDGKRAVDSERQDMKKRPDGNRPGKGRADEERPVRNTENIIEGHDLTFRYQHYDENGEADGEQIALEGIDLEVKAGQFIAILGHNGSGKSTLARQLNALLLPTGGTLFVDGYDTRDESHLWDIRQSAGMVFQNPDNQIIASVVEEDVGFGPENMGIPTEDIWKRVETALRSVGMWEWKDTSPNRLSGGQKQRVAIAGVIAMRSKCIILDEATAMLDPRGRAEVIRTVRELNRQEGVTVILITHYMEEVVHADRVLVMDCGRIVMTGSPAEIFSQVEKLKSYRLDVPQVTRLAYELKQAGADLKDGILTADELIGELDALRKHAALPEASAGGASAGAASAGGASVADAFPGDEASSKQTAQFAERTGQAAGGAQAAGTGEEPVVRIEHLNYIYDPGTSYEKKALDDVSLTIRRGEFIGIIGHTGSGKSTLIQHLNGLNRASSGQIFVDGEDIYAKDYPMRELRFKAGLVFQYPEHQLFETDVLKDVCFGPRNQGLPEEEVLKNARMAMRAVGLGEKYEKKSPFDLSGGQKRRAAIAGVLAMKPKLLVLDEPTAGLDPRGRDEILRLLKQLHEEKNITILLVSHSMEDVADYVDRIIVVDHGRILYDDAAAVVFTHVRELEKAGLAAPQFVYVMDALKEKGWGVNTCLTTIPEAKEEILAALKKEGLPGGQAG